MPTRKQEEYSSASADPLPGAPFLGPSHSLTVQQWESSLTSLGRSFPGTLSEMIHAKPFAQRLTWPTLNQCRSLLFPHHFTKTTSASGEMLLKRGDPQNPFFFCVVPVSIISLNLHVPRAGLPSRGAGPRPGSLCLGGRLRAPAASAGRPRTPRWARRPAARTWGCWGSRCCSGSLLPTGP